MKRQILTPLLNAVVLVSFLTPGVHGQRKRKYEEPKSQVLPLPPEPPMALAAETNTLDFHISPLLRNGGLSAQIRQSLNDLIRDTRGETIVKLRAFVAGTGDARRVQAQAAEIFTDHKLPLPVLSILQVGSLGDGAAKVIIEAVVATKKEINPNGLAFIAGQTGGSLKEAVERLRSSAETAGVEADRLLRTTCFASTLDGYEAARSQILGYFPKSSVNIVQAQRDPLNDAAMCEAVGQLSKPPATGPVMWLAGARTALVSSKQLIFTGLQLSFGNFLDDAHEAFQRLQRVSRALAPTQSAVEINAFSINAYAGSALRKMTSFPAGTLTLQTVEGLPAVDATGGIEAILATEAGPPAPAQVP